MEIVLTEWIAVTDASSVGEARRMALTVAQKLGLSETRAGEFALLTTEASRNVLLHGGGGQIVLMGVKEDESTVARILAIDKGPGIANLAEAMGDGYSTAGTMGGGLGAMKRMASRFEIFTSHTGTIALIEIGKDAPGKLLQVAGMTVPYPGERICGDGWFIHQTAERTLALLADGLGHGYGAAEASREAVAIFRQRVHLNPSEILSYVHDALRKTRGAVAAIAEIRPKENLLVYAGVGNISAVLLSGGGSRSLVSHNGTLGMTAPRIPGVPP